ncbi:hypothetical protein BDR07DRAFT_1428526, partial [Suillus spraguei]
MTISWNSPKRPKRDEVTKWHDSTNVILDYCQAYLQYGSATDYVQCSSLKDLNDAFLASTHLTYDERLAGHRHAIIKLKPVGYKAWARRYAVLHEKGYGARTVAADETASTDPHLVTIDPRTFVVSRTPSFS